MKPTILFLLTISVLFNISFAQNRSSVQADGQSPFVLGAVAHINSHELGEDRTLNVYLPEGYSPDSLATYPVIYLLDGSANEDFIHIAGLVQFMTMITAMPKSIVVGIANVDRKRDFTFPTTVAQDKKDYPTTGSSARFISFVEKELQPFVERHYRANNTKTIIGQSLGGLLATEILLKKPYLFNNYMIISPSLWWDNETLLLAAPQLLIQPSNRPVHVYIAVGSEGKQMEDDAKRLTEILQTSGQKNIQTDFVFFPDENHLTILHNGVYKGLQLLYQPKLVK
jgi:uncharacterized protein